MKYVLEILKTIGIGAVYLSVVVAVMVGALWVLVHYGKWVFAFVFVAAVIASCYAIGVAVRDDGDT